MYIDLYVGHAAGHMHVSLPFFWPHVGLTVTGSHPVFHCTCMDTNKQNRIKVTAQSSCVMLAAMLIIMFSCSPHNG